MAGWPLTPWYSAVGFPDQPLGGRLIPAYSQTPKETEQACTRGLQHVQPRTAGLALRNTMAEGKHGLSQHRTQDSNVGFKVCQAAGA